MPGSRDSPEGLKGAAGSLQPEVIESAKRGDRAAMEAVLEAHYDFVRRMTYRLLGPDRDLEDVVQTVLMRVVTSLSTANVQGQLSSWIGGICVHVVRDHLRRRKVRRVVVPVGHDLSEQGDPSDGVDLHAQLVARQKLSRFWTILDELSAEQRVAFLLHHIDGHSVRDVAQMMNAAQSTTRLRLYFARKKIAGAFSKLEDEVGALAGEPETG